MRRLIPALLATALGFSTAYAAPAKTPPFSNKSFGDGGGYRHPDAAVGQFFESKPPGPSTLKSERPGIAAKAAQAVAPHGPAAASRPRPRPFASVAAQTGGVESASLDSASEDARRDYEARLLGVAPAPRRRGLLDPAERTSIASAPSASLGEGLLFVSLELDPQEAGSLRDAVAGLGSAVDFRPDARFQPLPGGSGSVRISGWLPVSRLGDAIARPGVKRVAVERGSRSAGDHSLTGAYLLKLRVSDAARPQESIVASARELAAETGFKLERVFGVETVPGGGALALVSGTMPVSRLSRALGLPGVIQISPAHAALANSEAAALPAAPAKKAGFLKFVMARSLWLVLLTALLALRSFGAIIQKGLAVFVPYR